MAANMDGVGTFGVHNVAEHKLFTCLVKHYDHQDWTMQETFNPIIGHQTGTGRADWEKCRNNSPYNLSWICIDIANGYSEFFVGFIKKYVRNFPTSQSSLEMW